MNGVLLMVVAAAVLACGYLGEIYDQVPGNSGCRMYICDDSCSCAWVIVMRLIRVCGFGCTPFCFFAHGIFLAKTFTNGAEGVIVTK